MGWWHRFLPMPGAARERLMVIPAVLVGFVPHALATIIYLNSAPPEVWVDTIPWMPILLKGLLTVGAPSALVVAWLHWGPTRRVLAAYDWLGGGLLSLAIVWLGSLTQDLVYDQLLGTLGRLLIPFGTAVWGGIGIGLMIAGTAYLSEELRSEHRERQRLEALIDFTREITSLDYQAVLDTAAQHLYRLLGADACVLHLWDEGEQVLVPVAERHNLKVFTPEYVERMMRFKCPMGFGLTGWVMETGEPYICGDVASDPRSQAVPGWQYTERSSVLVPIQMEGRKLGVVRLTRSGLNQFTGEDLDLVQGFAGQAALVLQNARTLKELSDLSITDAMTGLYNARHFHQLLEIEAMRAQRYEQPLSLILADSDALKRVNDLLGHQRGDEHIRTIAAVLREVTRQTDFIFRYAGDEFLVLLPSTGPEAANMVAERIRQSMEERTLAEGIAATLSVGVATLPVHAHDGLSLLAAADAAMYESKRAGKNRVTMAAPGRTSAL